MNLPASPIAGVASPTSIDKKKIKFLLLEGVHPSAVEVLRAAGYSQIESLPGALPEDELKHRIADVHFLGIRSRTQLTAEVLAHAQRLAAVGCFCIGTNQVDLSAASARGVAVFNAPFSNTRSVAELVLAEAILLMRGIPEKNAVSHRGGWLKSASHSYEIRARRWASWGMAPLARSCRCWRKRWACRWCFSMWSPSCRWATRARCRAWPMC